MLAAIVTAFLAAGPTTVLAANCNTAVNTAQPKCTISTMDYSISAEKVATMLYTTSSGATPPTGMCAEPGTHTVVVENRGVQMLDGGHDEFPSWASTIFRGKVTMTSGPLFVTATEAISGANGWEWQITGWTDLYGSFALCTASAVIATTASRDVPNCSC